MLQAVKRFVLVLLCTIHALSFSSAAAQIRDVDIVGSDQSNQDEMSFDLDLSQPDGWTVALKAREVPEGPSIEGVFCLPFTVPARTDTNTDAGLALDYDLRLAVVRWKDLNIVVGRRALDPKYETRASVHLDEKLFAIFPGKTSEMTKGRITLLKIETETQLQKRLILGKNEEKIAIKKSYTRDDEPDHLETAFFYVIERMDEVLVLGVVGRDNAPLDEELTNIVEFVEAAERNITTSARISGGSGEIKVSQEYCGRSIHWISRLPFIRSQDPSPRLELNRASGMATLDFLLEWPQTAGNEKKNDLPQADGGKMYASYPSDFSSIKLDIYLAGMKIVSANDPPILLSVNAVISLNKPAGQAVANLFNGATNSLSFTLGVRARLTGVPGSFEFSVPLNTSSHPRLILR